MLFTDAHGYRNPECLSLFADGASTLAGRTPLQCYGDLVRSFCAAFEEDLGTHLVDVSVGCGPCGELRYPSYPENRRCPAASQWRFPGVGEFQCYDKRALLSLAQAAGGAGHIEWGGSGPHDAGGYNDLPHDTGFFRSYGGSWDSPYGQFFLGWYASELVAHGERVRPCLGGGSGEAARQSRERSCPSASLTPSRPPTLSLSLSLSSPPPAAPGAARGAGRARRPGRDAEPETGRGARAAALCPAVPFHPP